MMAMSEELFLVLIAFMGVQLSLIGAHLNTVAVSGSEVIMKCQTSSGNCRGVEWKKRNAQTAHEMRIFRNNEIVNDFRGHYSVNSSSGCNLLIKNVSLTDAGRFNCEYIKESSTVNELSLLIVLESLPNCSVKVNASSEGIAAEGDGIQFTCEVRLNATEGEASMKWKNLNNTSTSVKPGAAGRLLHSVVAKHPKIPSFECITTFDLPKEKLAGLASNVPTVPSCTAGLNVTLLYQVTNVNVTSSSGYSLGSDITCSADGNPQPSYSWQIADANGINETWTDIAGETGKTFKPTMTTRYNGTIFRCVANQTIRGKSFVVFSHPFQVNGESVNTGVIPKGGEFPILIIGSAGAAGVVAILIVIVIICICRVRSKEKKNKSGNDKSSGGDQIPLKPTPHINGSINPQMTTIPVASVQPQPPRGEAGKRPQIPAPEPKKQVPAPEPKKQVPAPEPKKQAPAPEPKKPIPTPEPKKHKDDAKKKRPDPPPQKEEVLYADLAMEQGPKRKLEQAPADDPHAVYADVHLA